MRPKSCADFRCTWLSDETWPEIWRPDHSGVLCLREEILDGLKAAVVYEMEPGTLLRETTQEIVEEMRRTTSIVVLVDTQQQRQSLMGIPVRQADEMVAALAPAA